MSVVYNFWLLGSIVAIVGVLVVLAVKGERVERKEKEEMTFKNKEHPILKFDESNFENFKIKPSSEGWKAGDGFECGTHFGKVEGEFDPGNFGEEKSD